MTNTTELKKTPFHVMHKLANARMTDFAGYDMPIQYTGSVKKEHIHCRNKAGLFDVSHMGQIRIKGKCADKKLERLVPSDIQTLKLFNQKYSVLINNKAGIIDDFMVTRIEDGLFVVLNAAKKEKHIYYIKEHLQDLTVEVLDEHALLALQGPESEKVLSEHCAGIQNLKFMQAGYFDILGVRLLINRCGYTGEDGFELSMMAHHAQQIAELLLKNINVQWIGLAARDSLRLEAGYCLSGDDIDKSTTPIEAQLNWIVDKYRLLDNNSDYPGKNIIKTQMKDGTLRKRVGIICENRSPLRAGMSLLEEKGSVMGKITSAAYAYSLNKPIAMGYVAEKYSNGSTVLKIDKGEKTLDVRVTNFPFVPYRYHR